MAQLLVRGLSEETVQALRERAKAHGRSVEAEHRAILEEAVGKPSTTEELIATLREMTWLAALDPAKLRDDEPPREFDFDPREGTTVRHGRPAPGHDRSD
ncbi:FitA-like ribbon-helix-helix domain-containing protein [Benzoatithermus flavus]|uniref:Arc family DNA-binding protein n=1 Tax=Benzoatithermus flavus TaxID=3108223 RepID=A0ABU8XNR9_9PROT